MTDQRAGGVVTAERPWNGWTLTHHGQKWHRVEFDSRTSEATLVCTGQAISTDGSDVLDYRWHPDQYLRCTRCAPRGWEHPT